MALTAGMRLGPYEIVAPIGAGGMGEVYRARDARLNRDVALKVLREIFSEDAERMARFGREAQVLASLNHPNIASLYGLEESNGVRALVMELVEGPTLAERIATRPDGHSGSTTIPLGEALPIAKQIAEALEYAHEKGVIHRDLKPANVKITREGTVKVLDFGLAKALDDAPIAGSVLSSPAMSLAATHAGLILGTAGYMSPEQARGKPVDKRADIWAFGVVLFEMLAGRHIYSGETVADPLAPVIKDEPVLDGLPASTPPAIRKLLGRCLDNDPKRRLRDIGEARIVIDGVLSGAAPESAEPLALSPQSRFRPWLPWAFAAAILVSVAAGTISVIHFREVPPKAQAIRFMVSPPEKTNLAPDDLPALSPDGERLAFTAMSGDGRRLLYVRSLDSLMAQSLAGAEGASFPFWSPDSRYIAFFAEGKLKRIGAQGGPPLTLCDAAIGRPGAWNRDGVILFRPAGGASLYRVSAAGGEVEPLTTLDSSRQETTHYWAQFLPDGRHFIYFAECAQAANSGLYAGSLDSRETKRLVATTANGAYTGPPPGVPGPGYLLFLRGDTLMAQPFDAKKLELSGEPFPVAEQVQATTNNVGGPISGAAFSVSGNGMLAYRRGSGAGTAEMVWLDRNGKRLGTVGEPADYSNPALSPDEKKLAVGRTDPAAKTRDIWLYDLLRGTSSRFTFDPADDLNPTWSPDGSRVAFTSERRGHRDIFQKAASGTGQDELLLESTDGKAIEDWSPDGKIILFTNTSPKHPTQSVWMFPLGGDRKPSRVVESPFATHHTQLSPDGRWMAYRSNESGKFEVYVQSFPPSGGKWQVSTNGGDEPRWRRDGKELFYLASDDELMAVDVKTESSAFEAGIPRPLFEIRRTPALRRNHYVVAANGQRFLAVLPMEQAASSPITVVLNWPAGLKR